MSTTFLPAGADVFSDIIWDEIIWELEDRSLGTETSTWPVGRVFFRANVLYVDLDIAVQLVLNNSLDNIVDAFVPVTALPKSTDN